MALPLLLLLLLLNVVFELDMTLTSSGSLELLFGEIKSTTNEMMGNNDCAIRRGIFLSFFISLFIVLFLLLAIIILVGF